MTGHVDFDARSDPRRETRPRKVRSEEEWESLWNVDGGGAPPRRTLALCMVALGAAVALLVAQRRGRRVSTPIKRFVPSAADIYVPLPPPR